MVALLLDKGADPNIVSTYGDGGGESPLYIAAKYGMKEIAALLLENGAEVNAKNHAGKTPLDVAEKEEIKKLLRARGGK